MEDIQEKPPVLQLRVVVVTDDLDRAVAFYRDTLGLPEQAAFEGDGDARVVILDAGRATLEIANSAQKRMIDAVEVGGIVDPHVGPPIRLAFEVTDTRAATANLESAEATLLGGPVETPWGSLNARLDAPADMQITLFEELVAEEERSARPGFGTDSSRGHTPG